MKWVMCNVGGGGAKIPKVYIGDLCLSVWGSKGQWRFTLSRLFNMSSYTLHQEDNFDTQTEAKKAAEKWFSEWVIEQFYTHGKEVEPHWFTEHRWKENAKWGMKQ